MPLTVKVIYLKPQNQGSEQLSDLMPNHSIGIVNENHNALMHGGCNEMTLHKV